MSEKLTIRGFLSFRQVRIVIAVTVECAGRVESARTGFRVINGPKTYIFCTKPSCLTTV